MVKGRVTPPKCLFHVAIEMEKDQYALTEQSVQSVLLKISIY